MWPYFFSVSVSCRPVEFNSCFLFQNFTNFLVVLPFFLRQWNPTPWNLFKSTKVKLPCLALSYKWSRMVKASNSLGFKSCWLNLIVVLFEILHFDFQFPFTRILHTYIHTCLFSLVVFRSFLSNNHFVQSKTFYNEFFPSFSMYFCFSFWRNLMIFVTLYYSFQVTVWLFHKFIGSKKEQKIQEKTNFHTTFLNTLTLEIAFSMVFWNLCSPNTQMIKFIKFPLFLFWRGVNS